MVKSKRSRSSRSSRKQVRRSRKARNTRRQGGGGYGFGGQVAPGLINNYGAEVVSTGKALIPDYNVAAKSDSLGYSGPRGLPGLSQNGGRYGFDLAAAPLVSSGGPSLGGIPQVMRIPCESASTTANTLNQSGGAGGVDSASYIAPTAGYAFAPSNWKDSVGAAVTLQMPYDAKMMNPACVKTGGARKRKARRTTTRRRQ